MSMLVPPDHVHAFRSWVRNVDSKGLSHTPCPHAATLKATKAHVSEAWAYLVTRRRLAGIRVPGARRPSIGRLRSDSIVPVPP